MSKVSRIIRAMATVIVFMMCLCVFRIEAAADGLDLVEENLGNRYYLEGFPLVYSENWLFQMKANEAVIIAYLGDAGTDSLEHLDTPRTVKMTDGRVFPVGAIGKGAFSQSNDNYTHAQREMGETLAQKHNIWKIQSLTINQNIDAIGEYAFSNNTEIKNITYSETVLESIGQFAFRGCTGFTDFTIPETVSMLGNSCFSGCTNLRNINIPSKVTVIPNRCFNACSALQNVALHSGVTAIGSNAFSECRSFTAMTLPDGINSIGASAFESCNNMKTINIPTSITKINDKTFAHCDILENVYIPANVTSIGKYAFAYRVYGREYEFNANAPNLPAVELSEGLKTIDSYAFYDIPGMKSLSIPYSVERIGNYAIGYYESQAGTRTIPGFRVFCYYDSAGEDYADANGFDKTCVVNKDAIIESNNAGFISSDKKGEVILTNISKTNITSYKVPKTIKKGNKTYTVTAIGERAFSDCKLLKTVTIEAEVQTIGAGAFSDCTALETVKIGDKLTTIEDEAFKGCKKLTTLTIGSGLQSIGARAFYKCKKLGKITIKSGKIKKIGAKAFKGTSKKSEYTLPSKKLKSYKKKFKKAGTPKSVTYKKLPKNN
ncbi:leucine-rich repeat domain-containing protein [Butyrivibrio sp. WCE2006]|uniref:leucine-rich repeat domain-containing protein n=1 Tax=Butyrivibrio sp. WCE2006 TaxID=1410611 RepID=UPI0005D20001|nr:leucine-rich repeat domain-containing protein [Butyrivibrio sp. WCE2006]